MALMLGREWYLYYYNSVNFHPMAAAGQPCCISPWLAGRHLEGACRQPGDMLGLH